LVVDDVMDFYETLKASHPECQWHYTATAEEAAHRKGETAFSLGEQILMGLTFFGN